jgi:hypothetical protein
VINKHEDKQISNNEIFNELKLFKEGLFSRFDTLNATLAQIVANKSSVSHFPTNPFDF